MIGAWDVPCAVAIPPITSLSSVQLGLLEVEVHLDLVHRGHDLGSGR